MHIKLDKLKIVNFKRENRDREKVLKQDEDSGNFDSIISKIPKVTFSEQHPIHLSDK